LDKQACAIRKTVARQIFDLPALSYCTRIAKPETALRPIPVFCRSLAGALYRPGEKQKVRDMGVAARPQFARFGRQIGVPMRTRQTQKPFDLSTFNRCVRSASTYGEGQIVLFPSCPSRSAAPHQGGQDD